MMMMMMMMMKVDGLQMWELAKNNLNKPPREADKGWSSSSRVGWVLTTPHIKQNTSLYEMLH
jgi:hypothetical protein